MIRSPIAKGTSWILCLICSSGMIEFLSDIMVNPMADAVHHLERRHVVYPPGTAFFCITPGGINSNGLPSR